MLLFSSFIFNNPFKVALLPRHCSRTNKRPVWKHVSRQLICATDSAVGVTATLVERLNSAYMRGSVLFNFLVGLKKNPNCSSFHELKKNICGSSVKSQTSSSLCTHGWERNNKTQRKSRNECKPDICLRVTTHTLPLILLLRQKQIYCCFCERLWHVGTVWLWCPSTAAESLNPQHQHQSHSIWPNSRHNLLLGRLAEDHIGMEMRLGSQRFREPRHNLKIPPSRSPGGKPMDQWLQFHYP